MSSYWKSVAAEMLPSWLKNRRAGGGAARPSAAQQTPVQTMDAAAPTPNTIGEEPEATGGGAGVKVPRPGTTSPKTR